MRHRETTYAADPVACKVDVHEISYAFSTSCYEYAHKITPSSTGTFVAYEGFKAIDDVETPDFFKRMKKGEIINSPLTKFERLKSQSLANFDIFAGTYGLQGCQYHSCFYWNGPYPSTKFLSYESLPYHAVTGTEIAACRAKALADAWSKVSGSDASVLASVGELRETVASLFSMTKRAISIGRAIHKLDLAALSKELTPKELANRYMEARYSIRPLLYDMKQWTDAFNDIKSGLKFKKNRLTFRGKNEYSKDFTDVVEVPDYGSDYKTVQYNTHYSVIARAGVLTDLDQNFGWPHIIGLTEPVEAIWELIPFSFIVDWFLNVGKIIATWTPNIGFKTLASWVKLEETVSSNAVVLGYTPVRSYDEFHINLTNCSISKVEKTVTRVPDPNRPILPRFDLHLDGLKLIDLAIILKNLL